MALERGDVGTERARIERVCDELGQPADDTLVPTRECRTEPDRLIVVRDWVDGSDLRASGGDNGTLSLVVALEVVSQVARGLDAARWAHGVVHGNLKPQNILLEPRPDGPVPGRVWVVDFGFWRPSGDLSEFGRTERAHRSAYLAPELVGGEEPTASSDQYALACVLYECLSGEPPFGGTESVTAHARLEERPPSIRERRPEISQAVDEAIGRALARQPEDQNHERGAREEPPMGRSCLGIRAATDKGRQTRAPGIGAARSGCRSPREHDISQYRPGCLTS